MANGLKVLLKNANVINAKVLLPKVEHMDDKISISKEKLDALANIIALKTGAALPLSLDDMVEALSEIEVKKSEGE